MAFGGVDATDGESGVVCTDGDPACDADAVADGSCRFTVSLCTGVPEEGCVPVTLASITTAGLPLALPPLPSTADTCGPGSTITVPVGTAIGVTAIARSGDELRDVDYLNLCCRAAAAPFDASRCALAIDPVIAGCSGRLPTAVRRFDRARAAMAQAVAHPERRRYLRRARRALEHVRHAAVRLARTDDCGDVLGLLADHALAMIDAGR